jgi:hypothetical protein
MSSTGFKQTGPTQQITTTGATAFLSSSLSFGIMAGAIRVVNIGAAAVQIILSDTQSGAQAPATLADGTPSQVMTLLPNTEKTFGPFQGTVWFNAAGTAANIVQFTPGSGGY